MMLYISDENGDQVYFRFFETNLLEKDGSIIYEPSKLRMSEDYIRYYRFAFLRTNTHTSHATYVVKSLTIQDLLPHSLLCSDAILVHAWFEHKDSMGPEACEGVSVL